jgi:hypothetical protein
MLAPRILNLNCHGREQVIAARIVSLNRHYLASRRFHPNYHPFDERAHAPERLFDKLNSDWHSLPHEGCSIVNTLRELPFSCSSLSNQIGLQVCTTFRLHP